MKVNAMLLQKIMHFHQVTLTPRRAYRQHAAVELSPQEAAWLDERLEQAFAKHGKLLPVKLEIFGLARHFVRLTPFDTNWKKGSGATPLATQDLFFGGAISIPTAPTKLTDSTDFVFTFVTNSPFDTNWINSPQIAQSLPNGVQPHRVATRIALEIIVERAYSSFNGLRTSLHIKSSGGL
jgi:hypothetical protein